MCELFGMSSRHPADVNLSLSELARHGGGTGPHRDGWGVAFYQRRDAWVIKEPAPAATSECERFVERHSFRSTLVVSHVRMATRGAIGFENTQPCSRELGGYAHVFAHNGDLPGLAARHPLSGRFRPLGDTDSEHAFCLLLERLEPLWLSARVPPALERRRQAVAEVAALLRELGPANFLYADGEALFVHGHRRRQPGRPGYHPPGLHVLCRSCRREPADLSGVEIASADGPQEVVVAATVPLTAEPWRPLAEGEIVVCSGGRIVGETPEPASHPTLGSPSSAQRHPAG